jgi:hypothetical protein
MITMKHSFLFSPRAWFALGLSLMAFSWVGCSNPGYRESESTAKTLQSLATRLESTGTELNIAVTELNGLVNNPQPDLRPQFDRFAAAVKKIHSLSNEVRRTEAKLEARGQLHFANWEKQLAAMQNDTVRYSGQKRKLELQSRFDAARNTSRLLLTSLGPVQADLGDVKRFLNSDLTSDGLAAIRDAANQITQQAGPARQNLEKLVAELRALAVALSPQNGPPAEQLK